METKHDFYHKLFKQINFYCAAATQGDREEGLDGIKEVITSHIEAERQKRDDMGEASEERERKFAQMLRTLIERGNADTAFNIIKEKSITQPNNPK